jgi:phosphonopyruvate decarboxylase
MSRPITAVAVLKGLASNGTQFVSGVPCSYFSGPLRLLEPGDACGMRYAPAVNEGAAVALAAGARWRASPPRCWCRIPALAT